MCIQTPISAIPKMGSIFSYLIWGGDPDIENPESGLSKRDIYNVQQSWKKVTANEVENGTELLIRYFEAYPENKLFFRTFKDMPADSLRTNIQFHAHALNITGTLTSMIANLETPALAAAMCKKMGSNHDKRKVGQKQFDDLKEVLVKLFVEALHFDGATMKSWVKVVTFIYGNAYTEMKA